MIPVGKAPYEELTKPKAGGLYNDELKKYARSYYASSEDALVQKEVLLVLSLYVAFDAVKLTALALGVAMVQLAAMPDVVD